MNSLEEVAKRVKDCTQCPLSRGRTHAVPGEGPANARVMFIGEAPGFHEDRQGRPFVGPAGRLLDELLQSVGLKREEVFIANMVKCRPSNNRDPLPSEIGACSQYLDHQIELINPDLVVTLGRYSLARFFPRETISRVRGKVRMKDSLRVLPLLHPAAALHQQSLQQTIREDFKAITAALAEAQASRQGQQPQESPGQAATPSTRQLSMF